MNLILSHIVGRGGSRQPMCCFGQFHCLLFRAEHLMFVTLNKSCKHTGRIWANWNVHQILDHLKRISNEQLLLLPWRRVPHPRETTFLTFPKDQPALLNPRPGTCELKSWLRLGASSITSHWKGRKTEMYSNSGDCDEGGSQPARL